MYMKKFVIICLTLITLPCYAETVLTGGVDYTVQSARNELLNTPVQKLNSELVGANLKDKNFEENMKFALNGKINLQDRTLAFFNDESYAVLYNDDKYHVWYYDKLGNLTHAEERNGLSFPYKSYKYTVDGQLVNMGIRVSKEETFIYSPQGKLIAHWLGQNAYDEANNVIMTRKYIH